MTNYLLAACIIGPIVLGVLAWLMKPWAIRGFIAVAAGLLTAAAGIALCFQGVQTVTVHLPYAAQIAEGILILVIIGLGIKAKSKTVLLLGIGQAVLAAFEMTGSSAHAAAAGESGFVIDKLGMIMVLIISIIGSAIVVYAIGYMKRHEHHAPATAASTGRFFFFVIGFLGLMNGLVLSDSLKWLAVFWEGTTLCSFFLIGHDGTDEARANARRALIINTIGGACMSLAGFLALEQFGGEQVSSILKQTNPSLFLLPVALLCVASMTKSAQMPFQSWLLGAMVAPTPVSALLHSSTMVKAGSYLVLRLAPAIQGTKLSAVIAIAGAFTFALTSALAISQSNGKKVLAYSTIANLGLIVACVGIGTPLAYAAGLFILIFHAVTKAMLFMSMGAIEQETGSRNIEDMSGLMFKMPLTATIAAVGMVAMIMPPLGMLIGKWMAIEAAIMNPLVLALLVLGSALTMFFWAKWIGRIITASHHDKYTVESMPASMKSILVICALAVVLLSFASVPLFSMVISPISSSVMAAVPMTVHGLKMPSLADADMFMQWPIFMVLGVGLLAVVLAMALFRKGNVRAPYLCGENVSEDPSVSYEFRSLMDAKFPAHLSSYYFESIFGEGRLTKWANLIALLIIFTIFSRIAFR